MRAGWMVALAAVTVVFVWPAWAQESADSALVAELVGQWMPGVDARVMVLLTRLPWAIPLILALERIGKIPGAGPWLAGLLDDVWLRVFKVGFRDWWAVWKPTGNFVIALVAGYVTGGVWGAAAGVVVWQVKNVIKVTKRNLKSSPAGIRASSQAVLPFVVGAGLYFSASVIATPALAGSLMDRLTLSLESGLTTAREAEVRVGAPTIVRDCAGYRAVPGAVVLGSDREAALFVRPRLALSVSDGFGFFGEVQWLVGPGVEEKRAGLTAGARWILKHAKL